MGLIPIGDAICRFNPVYGQGMSVAAREALLLHRLLGLRAEAPGAALQGLGCAFLADARRLIETPWLMSAVPDLCLSLHAAANVPPVSTGPCCSRAR